MEEDWKLGMDLSNSRAAFHDEHGLFSEEYFVSSYLMSLVEGS
jgi:hypothetical protein